MKKNRRIWRINAQVTGVYASVTYTKLSKEIGLEQKYERKEEKRA